MAPQVEVLIALSAAVCCLFAAAGLAFVRTGGTWLLAALAALEAALVAIVLGGGWFIGPSLIPTCALGLITTVAAFASTPIGKRTRSD